MIFRVIFMFKTMVFTHNFLCFGVNMLWFRVTKNAYKSLFLRFIGVLAMARIERFENSNIALYIAFNLRSCDISCDIFQRMRLKQSRKLPFLCLRKGADKRP